MPTFSEHFQAYQAELFGELVGGEAVDPELLAELRRSANFTVRATIETPQSMGCSMAYSVAIERHLLLNLSGMSDMDKKLQSPQQGYLGDQLMPSSTNSRMRPSDLDWIQGWLRFLHLLS